MTPLSSTSPLTAAAALSTERALPSGLGAGEVRRELPVGEALLSEAAEVGAGLLVMGAWGHRRVVERLLGGATRTLVHSMTMPVLFAH